MPRAHRGVAPRPRSKSILAVTTRRSLPRTWSEDDSLCEFTSAAELDHPSLDLPPRSKPLHPRPKLDFPCPGGAGLRQNVHVAGSDRIGIEQRVARRQLRLDAAQFGVAHHAVDDEMGDVNALRVYENLGQRRGSLFKLMAVSLNQTQCSCGLKRRNPGQKE